MPSVPDGPGAALFRSTVAAVRTYAVRALNKVMPGLSSLPPILGADLC
jgi:hypothetical protein